MRFQSNQIVFILCLAKIKTKYPWKHIEAEIGKIKKNRDNFKIFRAPAFRAIRFGKKGEEVLVKRIRSQQDQNMIPRLIIRMSSTRIHSIGICNRAKVEHCVNRSTSVYSIRIDSTKRDTIGQPTGLARTRPILCAKILGGACLNIVRRRNVRRCRRRGVWTGASGNLAARSSPRVGSGGVHRRAFSLPAVFFAAARI